MALSLHQSSVPVFVQSLTGALNVIDKLAAHCAARSIEPALFLADRLYPNMFTYSRQIQAMCDWANNTCAWLAGQTPPKFANDERTPEDWKARITQSIAFIQSLPAEAINAGESREITYPAAEPSGVCAAMIFFCIRRCRSSIFMSPPPMTSCAHAGLISANGITWVRSRAWFNSENSSTNRGNEMSIERIGAGPRMSKAVVHGNTVYLAGQVADKTKGGSVVDQTREILGIIDDLLMQAGSDKSKILSATIWLTDISTFAEMNSAWDAWVSAATRRRAPRSRPPRSARLQGRNCSYRCKIRGFVAADPFSGFAASH